MKRLALLALTTGLTTALLATQAHAMGSSGKRAQRLEEAQAECARIGQAGLPEWKQPDMGKFPAPSGDLNRYPLELPVVFHVVNHKGGFFSGSHPIKERELKVQLEELRNTYRQCGIETTLEAVHYWDAPEFLNVVSRSSVSSQYIGWEQRCLMKPTFHDERVNVYFVEGIHDPNGLGRSHAIARYWFSPEEAGDTRYYGAAFVTDFDRTMGGLRYVVTPHEVGHVVMDMGHVFGGQWNIMSDNRELLSQIVTSEQCQMARMSPFVRRR